MEDESGGKKGASFSVESLALVAEINTTGVRSMPLTLGRAARTLCQHRMKRQSSHVASWGEFRGWVAVQCGEDRRRRRIRYTTATASQPGNLGGTSSSGEHFLSYSSSLG